VQEKISLKSSNGEKEEKPQKQVVLVPNRREYTVDRGGSVRVADRSGITRRERKADEKAAKKARIKELKARKRK
jgi:hypothetical protein